MRTPRNDTLLTADGLQAEDSGAERRCILTGDHGARDALIRLALSPDGVIVPDILARAPGRGAWLSVDAPTLAEAQAKGRLKAALLRAFKGAALTVPDDLAGAIDAAFRKHLLSQFGLAARSGALLSGAEKVDAAARSGAVRLLLHAADAAEDGRRKRDQSWRVGEDAEGSGQQGDVLPVDRLALSAAIGRGNAVHIAIIDAVWAERIADVLQRWHRFATWSRGSAGDVCDTG